MLQDDEADLYVGVAKCLSEMSDTEIDRICQVTEVMITTDKYRMVLGRAVLLEAKVLTRTPSNHISMTDFGK